RFAGGGASARRAGRRSRQSRQPGGAPGASQPTRPHLRGDSLRRANGCGSRYVAIVTLSTGARRQIDTLLAAQPEAAPWLGVLSAALEAAADPSWDAAAVATTLRAERWP